MNLGQGNTGEWAGRFPAKAREKGRFREMPQSLEVRINGEK